MILNFFKKYNYFSIFPIYIIGLFYYTLGNISPQHRSQLKAIQLLAVARRPVIKKYGINSMLKKIMEELGELEKVLDLRFLIFHVL